MFDNEEKELMELSERITNSPTSDSIDEYIKRGISLGQVKKKRSKIRLFSNIAAVAIFAILITSIRVSPVLATYASKIPGLQYLVNLVSYDKGLKNAVDNNFVQHINTSQEHEGLIFTIKDIIIDKSKAIVFYSIENKTNHKFVDIYEMNLKDDKGKQVIFCSSIGGFINQDISKEKVLVGKADFNFIDDETIIPDILSIEVKLQDEATYASIPREKINVLTSSWKFNISVDKKKFESMKKIYTLNQNIEIEGQKILFKTVTITPTQIAADIEYDKSNSKRILNFEDIEIINEKGETWAHGMTSGGQGGNHETLFFQSNYFTNPKQLYIKGSSVKALDKDKLKVMVNVDKKVLLKAPDDKLNLKSVTNVEGKISLEFSLLTDELADKGYAYFVFQTPFEDNTGKILNYQTTMAARLEDNKHVIQYNITSDAKFTNPIYLTIQDYPSRIKGDFKVKIK
ncbi:MAG: DUF4179 domain-containing protein [Clostridiaceae bacterium]|nr:DUF4179 domain-containing protein [Clostridiaceae bacterium]